MVGLRVAIELPRLTWDGGLDWSSKPDSRIAKLTVSGCSTSRSPSTTPALASVNCPARGAPSGSRQNPSLVWPLCQVGSLRKPSRSLPEILCVPSIPNSSSQLYLPAMGHLREQYAAATVLIGNKLKTIFV